MNEMKIAVSGWYFSPNLYEIFGKIKELFEITVLTYYRRAEDDCPRDYDEYPAFKQIEKYVTPSGVRHLKIPVAGLEFGGYDWYVKNVWDRKSPVLFMHDDVEIYNIGVFGEIQNRLRDCEIDQAFIFRDEAEELANGRQHGRGVYCSSRFIRYMLDYVCECGHAKDHEHPHYKNEEPKVILRGMGPHAGFFYDAYNLGEHTSGAVPKWCRHYNEGIYHFSQFAGRCARTDGNWPGFKSKVAVYFPEFNSGKRGTWKGPIYSRGKEISEWKKAK